MKWAIWGGRVWGSNFPAPPTPFPHPNCLIWLKFLPELVLKDTKIMFEESLKNSNFSRNGRYPKFTRLVQL